MRPLKAQPLDRALPDLLGRLPAGSTPDLTSWRPALFSAAEPGGAEEISKLIESGQVEVHDTLLQQLADLEETRHPERHLGRPELHHLVSEHLGGAPAWSYGAWVHYPWSRALVHVLPEAEFRELRTSRNRNKITPEEQELLRGLRLGVVGLSVGQATAVTLALEEIGGELRLADFDTVELSNLNRMRAGVLSLGVGKAVLTAREIFEICPFARVTLFQEGITEENLDAFLLEGGKLSMVFEECDSLEIKVLVRQRARGLGIPVVMETSDRGMLDVERFDLEPGRPLFHGLAGELDARGFRHLTHDQKGPVAMRILGLRRVSRRMAEALADIGNKKLKGWPQLASAVSLGAALNTEVARRAALGEFRASGRFYVDLEEIVSEDTGYHEGREGS